MHEPCPPKKVYDIYERYPVSRDPRESIYSSQEEAISGEKPDGHPEGELLDGADFFDDPTPFGTLAPSGQAGSNDGHGLRPLRLLNSLFADRLDFLQRALEDPRAARGISTPRPRR